MLSNSNRSLRKLGKTMVLPGWRSVNFYTSILQLYRERICPRQHLVPEKKILIEERFIRLISYVMTLKKLGWRLNKRVLVVYLFLKKGRSQRLAEPRPADRSHFEIEARAAYDICNPKFGFGAENRTKIVWTEIAKLGVFMLGSGILVCSQLIRRDPATTEARMTVLGGGLILVVLRWSAYCG